MNRLDKPSPDDLAAAMQELRRRLGLTIEMAANKCGISALAWRLVEHGEMEPNEQLVAKIHDATGIDLYALHLAMHDYGADSKTPEPLKSACKMLQKVSGELIEGRIKEQTKTELN